MWGQVHLEAISAGWNGILLRHKIIGLREFTSLRRAQSHRQLFVSSQLQDKPEHVAARPRSDGIYKHRGCRQKEVENMPSSTKWSRLAVKLKGYVPHAH